MSDQRASFETSAYAVWGCGCVYDDSEQIRWCAHHVSGLTETINVRERELREMREERNEWKAKAEQAQHAEDINRELYEKAETEYQDALQDGSICPDPDEHATVNILQGQQRYYADVRKERDDWKKRAEKAQEGWDAAWADAKRLKSEEGLRRIHWCCMHMRWETPKGEPA